MIIDAVTYGKAIVRIQEAAEYLAAAKGDLHDCFPKAHAAFLRAGSAMPTQQMQRLHDEVGQCLQSVIQGDYSRVTDDELESACKLIMELNRLSMIFVGNF